MLCTAKDFKHTCGCHLKMCESQHFETKHIYSTPVKNWKTI